MKTRQFYLVAIALQNDAPVAVQGPENTNEQGAAARRQQALPDNDIDDMFAELNAHYIESQNAQIDNNNVIQIEEVAWRQRSIDAAEAELALYKMEPAIPLRDNTNEKYNCPLNWWKLHEFKYKMLSILAARYLCI